VFDRNKLIDLMAKTLFEHINAITQTQDKKYWDKLDESDRKTWSNFMVLRFLSMNPDFLPLVAQIQPILQEVPPKAMYLALIDLIPKGRYYLKYIKPKGEDKYESWLLDLVTKHYQVSKMEAEDYLKILYNSRSGRERVKELCEIYGTDSKTITKLKLNI
jgi:hypothetical protein